MKLLWLCLFFAAPAWAALDMCEVMNLKECPGTGRQGRRASAQSLPSQSTAAQFNPANVSHDRGVGAEVMYQPGESPTFGFVSGTGKAGAALISNNIENAFFGNRVLELSNDYFDRREKQSQYSSTKYTGAVGLGLLKNKSISLDIGGLFKYNTDTSRVNPGIGVSLRVMNFTFGASAYRDDTLLQFKSDDIEPFSGLPYSTLYQSDEYHEKFEVQTFYGGLKFKRLFIDAGVIRTHYDFYQADSTVRLYSAAYIWRKFLFNLAYRHENSPMPKYRDGELENEKRGHETYGGVQYAPTRHIVVGLHYNYYLLRELAGSLTLFW